MSYKVAKETLTANDKDRLLCVLLNANIKPSQVDWNTASQDFGSASVNSFKVMYQNTMKKITNARENGPTKRKAESEVPNDTEPTQKTPKKKPRKTKKSEWKAANDEEEEITGKVNGNTESDTF